MPSREQIRRRRGAAAVAVMTCLFVVSLVRAAGHDDAPPPSTEAPSGGSASVAAPPGAALAASTPDGAETAPTTPADPPASKPVAGSEPTSPAVVPATTSAKITVGDLVISGIRGQVASASLLRRTRTGQIAGVILMPANIGSYEQVRRLTGSLQAAAKRGGQLPLLITVDQEGGKIRRFGSARPVPSARAISRLPLATVERIGYGTGVDLLRRGANVDLAPVVDVPTTADNFLEERAFSSSASAVARNACQFAAGLHRAGVTPTLKHFPGLGDAGSTNTDLGPVTIRQSLSALQRSWKPYATCGAAPSTLVMVSNASYSALTDGVPALMSPRVYSSLRALGVTGPTITDAIEARSLTGIPRVATRAVLAGANLVLYTTEAKAVSGYSELRAATGNELSRTLIRARAAQVRALRAVQPR